MAQSDIIDSRSQTRQQISARRQILLQIKKYLQLFIGSIIAAVGLEIFLVPNDIIDGGVVGIAIMLAAITDIPMGIFLVLVNLPFLYFGYKQIGKSFAIATTFAVCSLSLWTAYFKPIPGLTHDLFLAAVFGGIIDGIGVGLIMRAGGSLDGTEIVAIHLEKQTPYSVGDIVMFFNLFILTSAGFLFGWDKAMYSLVAYGVIARTIDAVIKGFNESYAATIISNSPDEIADILLHRLGRGVTIYEGVGAYTGESKKILRCVVTRLEVQKLKDVVREIDDHAFVTITGVQDILGGRFKKNSIH